MTTREARKINWDRVTRWAEFLSHQPATFQLAIGVCHEPGNAGQLVICRPANGPSDREFLALAREALDQWECEIDAGGN